MSINILRMSLEELNVNKFVFSNFNMNLLFKKFDFQHVDAKLIKKYKNIFFCLALEIWMGMAPF
jgi:hypothetical protein